MKKRIKIKDTVELITGKDKGKHGECVEIDYVKNRIKVKGLNLKHCFIKKTEKSDGKIEKNPGYIHISNVKLKK